MVASSHPSAPLTASLFASLAGLKGSVFAFRERCGVPDGCQLKPGSVDAQGLQCRAHPAREIGKHSERQARREEENKKTAKGEIWAPSSVAEPRTCMEGMQKARLGELN